MSVLPSRLSSFLALAALSLSGCGAMAPGSDLGVGAKLSLDVYANTDVVGFHLETTRVPCDAADAFDPFTFKANVDLLDGTAPGAGIEYLSPFNSDANHLGADVFVSLDEGCYEVLAVPVSEFVADGFLPSADCSTASGSAVVESRETTDLTLLSQCVGDPTGALDAMVLLNNPPTFALEIDEKFNFECEPVQVCATVSDPNDDPVQVTFINNTNLPLHALRPAPLELLGFEDGHRVWRACAEIVTEIPWSYDFTVLVEDLGYDANGNVVPLGQVTGAPSLSELDFPIHTSWSEDLLCFDDNGVLGTAPGSDIYQEPDCGFVTADEYYCGGNYAQPDYITEFVCDDNGLVIPEALYPECSDTNANDLLDQH